MIQKGANITLVKCKGGMEIPIKTPKAIAIIVVMIAFVPPYILFTIYRRNNELN
jgi:hypothetical protein